MGGCVERQSERGRIPIFISCVNLNNNVLFHLR